MPKQPEKRISGGRAASFFTKMDVFFLILLFLLGLAITAVIYLPRSFGAESAVRENERLLEVRREGEILMTLPLGEDTTQRVDCAGGYNVFSISEGRAVMEESDCHDGTCMRTGTVSGTGETIVCLPHRLVLKVVQADDEYPDGPDAVAR